MSRRKKVKKYDSINVQGEGSFVKFSVMSLGEMRNLEDEIEDEGNIEYSIRKIKEHFVEWNWADEEGEPLPSPTEDDDVLDDLTGEEFNFLCRCVVGSEDNRKN